jgi:pimeloyl-ACP methyl ester carboxylesterase
MAGTFSLTINGSNFNTSNAQIVVTGPNCPTTTSCVVPNGVLTTKTSNQLVGPVTITTPGTFTIQVQNGSGTTLSNGASLTVNPPTPSISSISPTTVTAGTFSLTINGSNFNTSNAQIVVTGPNCPTTTSCVVPNGVLTIKTSNQLVGPVTINTTGSFTVQVQNGSGTTLSNGATLTVNAAAPSISNISPTTVPAGTFSLTINGSNFNTSNAQIVVTGPNCPTTTSCVVPNGVLTTKTSNQLVGPVTINTPGSFTIQVQNGSGTTLSNGASLTVNSSTPSISSISPTTVPTGTFSLTINGSNFNTSNAQIVVTGPNCPTTTSCVVPNGVLTTKTSNQLVGPVTITTPGSFTIQVQNGSGTTLSNGASLIVNSSTPSISSISPTTALAGTFSLTINGSNFNTSNAQLVVTGPNCPTTTSCVVPNGVLTTKTSNQLVGPVTINTPGSFTVQVQNGSGTTLSNGATLTVQGATLPPNISSISPVTPQTSPTDQNVTVLGANFQPGLTVSVTFPNGGTALLSGTQIQSVTSTSFVMRILLGAAGTWNIRVNNPDGGQSSAFNFAVQSVVQSPIVFSLNPATPFVNANDQDVFVSGANFQPNLNVSVNFPGGNSTLSGTQIQNVTSSSFMMRITLGTAGNWSIRVNNPDGGQSSLFAFSVTTGTQNPSVTSINPSTPSTQGADQNVIVNGSNFQDGLRVDVTFPSGGVSTLQGTGQIQNVTANSFLMRITLNAAGNWTMRVINPNGAQSGQFNFNVQASAPTPGNLPISVLSPVIGPLRVTSSNQSVRDGKWEFNQHKTGSHSPTGGISSSNDTFAWDVNLYTSTSGNADAGKAVYAVADGEVVSYVGTPPGGGPGAVLIAHPNRNNPVWFSGYLHLTSVGVAINQPVDVNTVIGEVGKIGADNDHLHFVVYSGQNTRGNLQSFNATLVERATSTINPTISTIEPKVVQRSSTSQLITINGANFQPGAIIEAQAPNGQFFTVMPEAGTALKEAKLTEFDGKSGITAITSSSITARVVFASGGTYGFSVINRTTEGSVAVSNNDIVRVIPSGRTPVILIPGIMGSRISKREGENFRNLWPGSVSPTQRLNDHRELKNNVENPNVYKNIADRQVVATDIVRNIAVEGLTVKDFYGKLITYLISVGYTPYEVTDPSQRTMKKCDKNQVGADLFVFPYDWRNSNVTSAKDLNEYVQCIKSIRGDPADFKVHIIAHSMGGLVARRYILRLDNPGTPHYVDRMVSLGTPWLGAPKFLNTLEFGDKFWDLQSLAILPTTVKELAPHIRGAHELIPSKAYVDDLVTLEPFFPFGEDGWDDFDFDPVKSTKYSFNRLRAAMNLRYANRPGDATNSFHSQPGQDDWSRDTSRVTYFNFVGYGEDTTVAIIAKRHWVYGNIFDLVKTTDGDGTVPLVSALRNGRQDYRGPIKLEKGFPLNHGDLVSDGLTFGFINCVVNVPDADACISNGGFALKAAQADRLTFTGQPGYQLKLIGSHSITISDSFGNTTNPLSTSIDEGIRTVQTDVTSQDYLSATFPLDQSYRVVFRTRSTPVSVLVTKSDGQATTQAVRYVDITLPANVSAIIELTPQGVTLLKYDSDGNGTFDTTVNPTASVTGSSAQDLDAPVIAATETFQDGLSQIGLQATDAGTGVERIMYSINGTTYQLYTGPLTLNPAQTPIVFAFADDKVANRSAVFTFAVTGSSTLPLELVLDESNETSAALDSVLFVRDPFQVVNPSNLLNTTEDRNTRLVIFATNLQLAAGDPSSSVVINLVDSNGIGYDIPAEDVRPVVDVPLSQVVFRLPSNLPSGVAMLKIRTAGRLSNPGSIRIAK